MKTLIAFLIFFATSVASANTAVPTEHDPLTAKREIDLATKLRCLVCQNQSIAESNAELAQDLRRQIHEQIVAGKSDREIVDYMTARYGDFVLYQPPFKGTTLLLWLGPLLLLLAGAYAASRVIRARRRVGAEAPLSDEERRRAETLLQGKEGAQ